MTEATQTANPNAAREAAMSRVTTQDMILAKLASPEAALAPAVEKSEADKVKDGEVKPKKTGSERFQELIARRTAAEAKLADAERERDELRARVDTLSTQAKPMQEEAKPLRSKFATDDDYIEALTDWKAKQAISKREQEAAQARAEADSAETARQWSQRQDAVMKALPDYAEVIGKSEVQVPEHVHFAILESEQGPQIAYYLALHPEEARRIVQMTPIRAIKRIAALERDMMELEAEEAAEARVAKEPDDKSKANPTVRKPGAPPPIEPVRSVPSSSASSTNDFEEYKRRRQAEKRK